eukprot:80464-Chlamydomonas_euryale.AAC.1
MRARAWVLGRLHACASAWVLGRVHARASVRVPGRLHACAALTAWADTATAARQTTSAKCSAPQKFRESLHGWLADWLVGWLAGCMKTDARWQSCVHARRHVLGACVRSCVHA